jgi:hypothetical protein
VKANVSDLIFSMIKLAKLPDSHEEDRTITQGASKHHQVFVLFAVNQKEANKICVASSLIGKKFKNSPDFPLQRYIVSSTLPSLSACR